MDTIFQFSSAQEITNDFVEQLKSFYKGKPVSITVKEETIIPDWQKEEVLKRRAYAENHPETLIDFDEMMIALEKELQDEN